MSCAHPETKTWRPLVDIEWCLGCGALRVAALDDRWSRPELPGEPSAVFETLCGVEIQLLEPRAADVRMEDIAHNLCLQTRFNGAVRWPYSVGDHSLCVARGVCEFLGGQWNEGHVVPPHFADMAVHGPTPRFAESRFFGAVLRGLVHDAPEAYLGDCIKPLKGVLPVYQAIEGRHAAAIHSALGFDAEEDWAWADLVVDCVDKAAFAVEHHVLRGGPEASCPGIEIPAAPGAHWQTTKDRFLTLARRLHAALSFGAPFPV